MRPAIAAAVAAEAAASGAVEMVSPKPAATELTLDLGGVGADAAVSG